MAPSDLEEILQAHGDNPVRLTLSSGDVVDIPHRDAARISGTFVVVFPNLKVGGIRFDAPARYVSLVNIALAKPAGTFGSNGH